MKRGIMMLLCVTGLTAIGLLISSRKRMERSKHPEYWYPYMQA